MEIEGGQVPERFVNRWGFESHLQEYALLVARKGKNGLESIENFPNRIELSDEWHHTLNKMRTETAKDMRERVTPIGFQHEMRKLHIPPDFIVGAKTTVSDEMFWDGFDKVKKEKGIVGLVGHIHSHPRDWDNFLKLFVKTWGRIVTEYKGFSPGDLHGIVENASKLPWFYGVVDKDENYFAFVTRESETIHPSSKIQDSATFQEYWFYHNTRTPLFKNSSITIPKAFTLWDVDMAIAKQYRLALYRGKPGEDLVREFPKF